MTEKQTSGSGDGVSLPMWAVREHEGGYLTGESEGKIKRDILSER